MAGVEERVKGFLETWHRGNELDSFSDRIEALKKEKMARGFEKYGELNLDTDIRDFRREAISELTDALNYLDFSAWQGRLPFCKWYLLQKEISFIIWRLEGELDPCR